MRAPAAAGVAPGVHGARKVVRVSNGSGEERHRKRDERADAVSEAAAFELRAAGDLRVGHGARISAEGGDEVQRDGEHEHALADGHADAFERGEQTLGGVGEGNGRRGDHE